MFTKKPPAPQRPTLNVDDARPITGKRLVLLAVAGLLTAAAALAIGILLFGDFGSTEGRILATTALLAGYGLLTRAARGLRAVDAAGGNPARPAAGGWADRGHRRACGRGSFADDRRCLD
jgi:hypothetical protein